ncbi:ABC transporter permease [Sorangium sp. So ce136]|uniref:ABC transporter permease n=1 Tax=Sorangium sp. So ce136 TaxID=3133284 RepID=UPI003F01B0A7
MSSSARELPGAARWRGRLRELRGAALPAALALGGVLLALNLISFGFGEAPASVLRRAFEGTWGTPYGVGQVLFKATPLLFTGLAFSIAMRAGLFNIGAEGQVAMASLAGAVVAAELPRGTPWPVAVPASVACAMATGAAVALVPALLRARLGAHEIISGIMMNRVVDVLAPWLLASVLGRAAMRTADVIPAATLPRLDRFVPALRGSAASVAFVLAVALAFAAHRALSRSRAGREMRFVGQRAEAARAEGIDVPRRRLAAMLASGAVAGAAMTATTLGYKGYYELGLGAGAGFSGIPVALLGRGTPLGLVLAAVLFGTLEQAGLAINARVPKEAMDVLEALVIILAAAAAGSGERARRARHVEDAPA